MLIKNKNKYLICWYMPAGHCFQRRQENPKDGVGNCLGLLSKNVTTPTPWQIEITLQHKHWRFQLGIPTIKLKYELGQLWQINITINHNTEHGENHFIKEQVWDKIQQCNAAFTELSRLRLLPTSFSDCLFVS